MVTFSTAFVVPKCAKQGFKGHKLWWLGLGWLISLGHLLHHLAQLWVGSPSSRSLMPISRKVIIENESLRTARNAYVLVQPMDVKTLK